MLTTVANMMSEIGVPQLVIQGMLLPGVVRRRGRPRIKRPEINLSEWLSRKKAAKALCVSSEEMTSLIKEEALSVTVYRGKMLISVESIEKYKEKHPSLGIKPKKKRGRPPKPKPSVPERVERTKKSSPSEFVPIEQAEARTGLCRDEIFSLIGKGKITPAIKKGSFFVKLNVPVDSCKKIAAETKKAKPSVLKPEAKRPVVQTGNPGVPDCQKRQPEPERKFIPSRLTPKETVSKLWTSNYRRNVIPSNQSKSRINPDEIGLELVEYQPGKWGYDVGELAPLMRLNPITLNAWLAGFKVEGKIFPDGRAYIERESLKRWLLRTAPKG